MAESLELQQAITRDTPETYVRKIVEKAGSSFIWAMRLLPPSRRHAMYGIYAFCRCVDDIADGPETEAQKHAKLEAWREEVEQLFAGTPKHPIMQALQPAKDSFNLPKAEFLAVIDGMEMDARASIRAPVREDFTLYCRRVAGAVGLLSIHAFGARGPAAEELAVVQGEALQITNILRDLWEDAARGRLYVPRDLLKQEGIEDTDPLTVLKHPNFTRVHAALCAEADRLFSRARELIAQSAGSSLRPARLMLEVYGRLLERVKETGWPHDENRITLRRAEKLWLVLRYGLI
ncbi:presqualene diphosphate synthase HpnD [Denitrobaculum tricleocarpae]|nr:presqualene diphosphate synthase HpnD [Denitrobaculum tricleocarpae]